MAHKKKTQTNIEKQQFRFSSGEPQIYQLNRTVRTNGHGIVADISAFHISVLNINCRREQPMIDACRFMQMTQTQMLSVDCTCTQICRDKSVDALPGSGVADDICVQGATEPYQTQQLSLTFLQHSPRPVIKQLSFTAPCTIMQMANVLLSAGSSLQS